MTSEPYGIPLRAHFSPTQFTLAVMDNFDHSDAISLAGISAVRELLTNKVRNIPENFDVSEISITFKKM